MEEIADTFNDIAQLNAAESIEPNFNITYRETRPGSGLPSCSQRRLPKKFIQKSP